MAITTLDDVIAGALPPRMLVPNAIDALTSGFPRIYDDSVPFLVFIPSTTTASVISGHMVVTQG